MRVITGSGLKQVVDVEVSSVDGTSIVKATAKHLFWESAERSWIAAGDLTPGESMLGESGAQVDVVSVRPHTEVLEVYNLTIANLHTFYVSGGRTSFLVHNNNILCGLGGFKIGVEGAEVEAVARGFGGEFLLNGSPGNMMINASRYTGFWEKVAVVIRDIAGSQMYNNGNKRTALAVAEMLMARNGVTGGPTSADLSRVVYQVGKGQLTSVEDIAAALRGY
jgi:Pretoxin HINT domain